MFFNVPARRKFLRTVNTEGRYINEIISKIALSRPDVHFRLLNNDKEVINTPGNGNLVDTIASIYGKNVANDLIALKYEDNGIGVSGYIGKPTMTFSILPFKTNSSAALKIIKNNGQTPMLHLPMEPMDAGQASETRMVSVAMTKEQVQNYTKEAINSLPGIKGVNNHQGSRATSNPATMRAVLEVLQSKGLFFIDSRTLAASVGYKMSREMGISTGFNSRFLDNSSDVDEIKKQIWAAAEIADKYGSIIVICHETKPFFGELITFITSGPVAAMVIEGENAIKAVRGMMGATNPLDAVPGSIRGDFALTIGENIVHG